MRRRQTCFGGARKVWTSFILLDSKYRLI